MELEQKYGVDRESFILKMSLSSDSEIELDKQSENGAENHNEINKQLMNETDDVVNNEPKVMMGNESKIFMQDEAEIGNCSYDNSFKSKAKRKTSYCRIKKREKWGWREEIAIVNAVRDCVNCHFGGVKSASTALCFKKNKKFWTEVQKNFNAQTGNCNSSQFLNRTFNALRMRYYHKRKYIQHLNPYQVKLFGIFKELFGDGRKWRSDTRRTAKKPPANDDEGLSVKRAKWSSTDEILFASVVRDGISRGLNDMNSGKNVTCFKTNREFWDEVTKTLQEKTGKSASPLQVLQKFRNLRAKLMTKKKKKTLSQHDEQVLGILEQVYGKTEEWKLGLYESPMSDTKEVSIDDEMSTEKKSMQSTCTRHDYDLFCGYELRDRDKPMKGVLKPRTKKSNENSPRRGSKSICLQSGENKGGMQLRARFSPVKPLAKEAKRSKRQNSNISCDKEENFNADSLPAFACNKKIKRGVKEGLEPKDEISIANAVRDGMICGIGGLKSARDAMSFRTNEGFWIEMSRKFSEETGKSTSAYELFQAFRSSKYKYLNSKRSLTHELSQHDEELFSILEQVFSKDKKHRIGFLETQLFDADDKLIRAQPSGNQVEKLSKRNGASTEQSSGLCLDDNQDNQTFKDLSSHLVSADKEEESSSNFLRTANTPLPIVSPEDVLCQGGKGEATFPSSVKHGVENSGRMKSTRSFKDKFRRPNRIGFLESQLFDADRKLIWAQPSGNQVEKLSRQNGASTEQSPGLTLDDNQDNQTFKDLSSHLLVSADKEEESSPNFLKTTNTLPIVSPGDVLCQGGKGEATFSFSVKHAVENSGGMKNTRSFEYKFRRPNRTGFLETQLFDADSNLIREQPSGNQVEKLSRQNGASREQNPGLSLDDNQNNQTFKNLSSHLLLSADKEEESSPNFLKTANTPLHIVSPGDVLCQGGKGEATFSSLVKHGVENSGGMKDTRSFKDKFRRSNEQAELHLKHRNAINQDNQTHKELPCQVPPSSDGSTGKETQHQKEEQSYLNVLNGFDLPLPSVSFRDPLHCGKTKATFSDPVNHGMKNLDVLKDTENTGGKCKILDDGAHGMPNEIVEECMQDPQNMTFRSEGKNKQSNREQLVTDNSLNDVSCHGNDYTEVVKRLEWRCRKLQLMQEIYKIEQLEVEDRIRQAKLKAFPGNP